MSTRATARRLHLKVHSHTAQLRTVRVAVEEYCKSHGFDEKACGEIGLCVNEAMANVIRHAYRGAADKPIEIQADMSPDGDVLTVTIRDWGQALDTSTLPRSKDDLEQPGGLGLICLRTLMDDVQFIPQTDGTLLRMTRRLKTDSGGAGNKRHNEARTMAELKIDSELVPSARTSGDAVVAAVRGEIDLHNSPELRTILLDVLQKNPCKRLVLDLSQVPYMDSSAIAVLVESLQKLRKVGGRLFLIGLQPRVKGLLEIARLDSIFVIAKDEQEAMSK